PKINARKTTFQESPATLLSTLQMIEQAHRQANKLLVYASMSHSVDMADQVAIGMYDRVQGVMAQVQSVTSFLNPGLIALGRPTLDRWRQELPALSIYTHYFDNLFRQQAHVRSAEVEELLGSLADSFSGPDSIFGALTDADFQFRPASDSSGGEVPVAQGTLDAILNGADREARRTAWESYRDTYLSFKNTLSGTLSTSVKNDVFQSQARHHASTLEAALFDDNLPINVFHNLITVFQKNLPTWHRYWRLRRKALGVKELHPYDIWAPLTTHKPKITYLQAVDYISSGLSPLGQDYVKVLRQGCLTDRWVDIYPNPGKTASIFSAGAYDTFPFICTNYTDDIESLSTLAHELGHSMHSYLTWHNQPFIYGNYSTFVAEVASNFHQAMVRAHLLETLPEPSSQISILEEAMSNFHRYFFIMPTLARFELEVHRRVERGEGLTADAMISLMADLFTEGYGGEMQIDRNRVGITWATFGHLYYDYYVFQYATGISAAHTLSNRVLKAMPSAATDYLKFLSAGSSVYPIDALKIAGVDLTQPQPVEETFRVLGKYVDRLEGLLGK
ncbi:MAG: oligoendopeptidase F, partial [Dehalococcoidales bacterium]|nr:oligoendopeptidase F [Dehalococcoidales bacterium]